MKGELQKYQNFIVDDQDKRLSGLWIKISTFIDKEDEPWKLKINELKANLSFLLSNFLLIYLRS